MGQSAKTVLRRRTQTGYRVWMCAQQLTDERGFDGFTMDDLAELAGVSRRTLFNYFPGKADAVLGTAPELTSDVLVTLSERRGSDLMEDLLLLGGEILGPLDITRAQVERMKRVIISNPRLLTLCYERMAALSAQTVAAIRARDGDAFDGPRTVLAVRLVGAILDAAMENWLAQDDGTLVEAFEKALRGARELLS
ncbi:TetR family transcriptional regulator [Rhodococcus sp. X156]|uniref:TetR family transcriptional regulator n=1 Tax=Rhodococcus sp. X156 TaxID=2499145 RepID=UPI000FD7FBB7|nr:TetR family transcriptional regulator [Rhodococcus sp. X156]